MGIYFGEEIHAIRVIVADREEWKVDGEFTGPTMLADAAQAVARLGDRQVMIKTLMDASCTFDPSQIGNCQMWVPDEAMLERLRRLASAPGADV